MIYQIKMKIRRYLPEPIKRCLRALFLACNKPIVSAPALPQKSLDNCRFLKDRFEMLKHLPKGGNCVEIGSLYGDYAHQIIEISNPKSLTLIDIDFSALREDVKNHECVNLRQGLSVDILQSFEDEAFDWIYIDGDHTYKGVCQDIEHAKSKVKPGGYLVFNDFCRISGNSLGVFGVHQAVCEFIAKEEWDVAYFCFESGALYDLALQRPLKNS